MNTRRFALWLVVLATGGTAAGGVLAGRLLAEPESIRSSSPRPGASGLGAQQGLVELLLRSGRVSARTEPIVIEDGDLNAFLARHFHARRLTLEPLYVRAGAGWLEVTGRTSARRATASSGSKVWRILPGALLDLEVWLSARGRLAVVAGAAEVTIDRVVIGRQSVPPSWLWGLTGLDPRELLAWRLPPIVERIAIEPGRVVIHTRPGQG